MALAKRITLATRPLLLKGIVESILFTPEREVDSCIFSYCSKTPSALYKK